MTKLSKNWRPIEACPHKGNGVRIVGMDPDYWRTRTDLWCDEPEDQHAHIGECMWVGLSERWILSANPESNFNPTHWQPMPNYE